MPTTYVDPTTLGTDENYPEVYALYIADRLGARWDVEIGIGRGDLSREDSEDAWEAYCSLSLDQYRTLALRAIRDDARRDMYLATIGQ